MQASSVYPCLWFDNQAGQAANHYCSIFQHSRMLKEAGLVTSFEVWGTKLIGLNGGPHFTMNPSLSFYVYCGNDSEITRLYEALSPGSTILMPLGKYGWSEKYTWFVDSFGVNWQLDIADIASPQKIVPTLLFANEKMGKVKDTVMHYTRIFSGSAVLLEAPYPESAALGEGTLLFSRFSLNGFIVNAMSSTQKHDFDFSPGSSLVVECETQQEIDFFWEKLAEGGKYSMCGWLEDSFGVSWQIIPVCLAKLMSDPERRQRVNAALMKMKKIEIEKLEEA